MTAIWLSRSVPGTSKIYTARSRDPIALTAAYIAHTGAPKPDARLHLPYCRRWHDRRRGGAGPSRGRPRGLDRPDQRRAASSLRPASALEGPLEGRAGREDLAEDGRDGRGAAPGAADHGARSPGAQCDGRPGHRVSVPEVAPRHRRRPAAPATQDRPDHLFPHPRRLPQAARALEPERALRGDRRRVHRQRGRRRAADAAARRHDAHPGDGTRRARVPGGSGGVPRGLLPRKGRHHADGGGDGGARPARRLMRRAHHPGRRARAEVLVAGLGIVPGVELAEQAGLRVDNGIVVDEACRTSQIDIYAAGDVANFTNPALRARLRVEHEDNANTMGRTAGLNMAGRATPYHHLPFFYSDLFELGYEAVGDVDARLEMVADWKEKFREGVVYYLKDGRVRGVLLWNTWGQVDHARALIAEPGPFKPQDLKGRLPA